MPKAEKLHIVPIFSILWDICDDDDDDDDDDDNDDDDDDDELQLYFY